MLAILFAGQGIQSRNMFDGFDKLEVKKFLDYSSDLIEQDITKLLNLPESEAYQSKNVQLLVTVYSCFVLDQWKKFNGPAFNYSAGYSMGEYIAGYAAGAFSYAALLKIIQFRATAMEKYLECESGYTINIYDKTVEEVENILAEFDNQNLKIVGYTSLMSNNVAGETSDMDRLCRLLDDKKCLFKKYDVCLPFHTKYLIGAGKHVHNFLEKQDISDRFSFPIISSTSKKEIVCKEDLIIALSEQIHTPVRWTSVLTQLCKSGVTDFVVFCPSNKLFWKPIHLAFPDLNLWHIHNDYTVYNKIYTLNEKNINHLS